MLPKTICYTAIIALFIACAVNIATARTVDQIIAYLNDEVITKSELDTLVKQRAIELQQTYHFNELEAMDKAKQERSELLDRLIRQMLLVETALTLKIDVTDEEIEQYIQDFKSKAQIQTQEDFINQLKKEGFTLAAFHEQAKRNLMAEKLVMQRILPKLQIRDSDVQRFFEENQDQFSTKTDKVHLRHIFIAFKPSEADRKAVFQKIEAILKEAKGGADFEALAQRYSEDENAKSNAGSLVELPTTEIEKLAPPFRAELPVLGEGEISKPIEGSSGIYLFKVEHKTDQTIEFRYLVISLKPGEAAIQEAQERAALVHQKLDQGEDFNALAAQYSDDMETREKGGDLGVRSLSELNPETRQIIAKLDAEGYSEPVNTKYGVHIFKIDSRTTPELSEMEKNQIRGMLREQKFQEEWKTYTDMLLENAYVKIKPLE